MISVIIPVYNNEGALDTLYCRLSNVLSAIKEGYELIFIDDASKDAGFALLGSLHNKDSRVKIIKLRKNSGQARAVLAGLHYVKGDIIILIDADLQYSPEDIPLLLNKISQGYKVVFGWRKERKDRFFPRKLPSYLANIYAKIKLNTNIKDIGCTFMAFNRDIISSLDSYSNATLFLKPLLIKLTNNISEVEVAHYPRMSGLSQYGLVKLIKIALDFAMNFSFRRLRNNRFSPSIIEKTIG
ncbi:MAG: glycosyltransferase family 2 protein [Candidatus Omnitrophota bacterium]